MPDATIGAALRSGAWRLRLEGTLWALSLGGVLFAALALSGRLPLAAVVSLAAAGWVAARAWARWTAVVVAAEIERRNGTLDNLLMTAAEVLDRPRPMPAHIRDELARQTATRVAAIDLKATIPLTRAMLVAVAVGSGAVATAWTATHRTIVQAPGDAVREGAPSAPFDFVLRVQPPAYTGLPEVRIDNPVQPTVLAGSLVRIESVSPSIDVTSTLPLPFTFQRDGERSVAEWTAKEPLSFTLRRTGAQAAEARLLSLLVAPDLSPSVRVVAPGRDLVIGEGATSVAVEIEASDDLALAALELRYTRASGAGESVAFREGTVRLDVSAIDSRRWTARADWRLGPLNLEDGDILVYRAVARDRNPDGVPAQSTSFVIEVGRQSSNESAGFSISTDDRRYAVSQQMVIYKTEQLLSRQREHRADWLEQTRMIAVEQRMVRSEVVFLNGGEIEDEEVEAAASDELTEGRLRSAGRQEMLRAINAMSRAESHLNSGDARAALAQERVALQALERALDRRRYFLRTTPDRSRIDSSRRLSGTLTGAGSWVRERERTPVPDLERQRALMRDLVAAESAGRAMDADLAARLVALDPSSTVLQQAAVGLATAPTPDARALALQSAIRATTAVARRSLASPTRIDVPLDPLQGHLADELAVRKDRRR